MAVAPRFAFAGGTGAYATFVVLVGAFLIQASEGLIFQNDGDFFRTSGFMLQRATHGLEVVGDFRIGPFGPIEEHSPAAYIFLAFGWVQRLFSPQFHLAVSSIGGKLALLAGLAVLASVAAGPSRPLARAGLFLGLALCAFAAHNSGLLKSFYLDYAFFLALPLLMAGLLAESPALRYTGLLLGSAVAGLAKIQFFYVPGLVLASLLLAHRRGGPRMPAAVAAGLLLVQAVCVLPALANPHRHLNYYHSTFFGSYMVMSPQQLQTLHLSDKEMKCIGVDAWGNFATGPGALEIHPGKPTCVTDKPPAIARVFEPYLAYPQTAARLFSFAFPAHFTVDYFHVSPEFKVLQVLEGPHPPGEALLLDMTHWRERYLTPLVPLVLLLALVMTEAGLRCGDRRFAALFFFLATFVVSQVILCLLGEGVRDLSRHLWAAQLSVDLLMPLLAWRLVELGRQFAAGGRPRD